MNPQPRGRVLIVDDDADTGESLAILLGLHAYATRWVTSVERFLAEARDFAPTAVLLDLRMPGCDGFEALRRFRALPGCATTPVIAVSGYARDVDRQMTFAAGFALHLAKPFEIDAAIAAIREVTASD